MQGMGYMVDKTFPGQLTGFTEKGIGWSHRSAVAGTRHNSSQSSYSKQVVQNATIRNSS